MARPGRAGTLQAAPRCTWCQPAQPRAAPRPTSLPCCPCSDLWTLAGAVAVEAMGGASPAGQLAWLPCMLDGRRPTQPEDVSPALARPGPADGCLPPTHLHAHPYPSPNLQTTHAPHPRRPPHPLAPRPHRLRARAVCCSGEGRGPGCPPRPAGPRVRDVPGPCGAGAVLCLSRHPPVRVCPAQPDGRLPDGDKDAKHIRDIFGRCATARGPARRREAQLLRGSKSSSALCPRTCAGVCCIHLCYLACCVCRSPSPAAWASMTRRWWHSSAHTASVAPTPTAPASTAPGPTVRAARCWQPPCVAPHAPRCAAVAA